jgi:hypothetical protein
LRTLLIAGEPDQVGVDERSPIAAISAAVS